MEFDEMKKIWDAQDNAFVYGINEQALHNRILSKQHRADHTTNFSELLLIIVNLCSGTFIFVTDFIHHRGNILLYLLAAWMLVTALYILIKRVSRIRQGNQFNRSMRGDLAYAISVAGYQVRLSQLIRWNTLPIGILTLLAILKSNASPWFAAGILVFFVLVHFASRWEHGVYKNRKRELEVLQGKLDMEG